MAQQKAMLDKKFLRAPFAGHLGIRAVDLGQYLGAGTAIVTLQALDPIFIDFFVPQQAVDQVKIGQQVAVKIDAYQGPDLHRRDLGDQSEGRCHSRNVQIRATLKNADHKLIPGMYATVDIPTGGPQNLITLPQTAITYNPYGDTVYIVDNKGNDAERQAATDRAASLRHHRRHPRRSGRGAQGRQRRRHDRHLRPDEAAQRLDGPDRQFGHADADASPNVPLDRMIPKSGYRFSEIAN